MRTKILLTTGLMMLAATQTATAARPLDPPVEELLRNPERNRVVVAVAEEKLASPKVKFTVSDRLSGESPDELLLRTDEKVYADLVVGEKYIIAWTDMRKERLLREGYEVDPEGPSIVMIKGQTLPAFYKDSPEIRYLFNSRKDPDSFDAGLEIDALLGQIQRDDVRGRELAVGQMLISRGLVEQMTPEQAGRLKTLLQKTQLRPMYRDYLLQSALRLPEELRSPWLGESFRRIIIRFGTHYDLGSFVPGLVRTSAKGLGDTGDKSDIELLSILLYANNPGVSKAALDSMARLDRDATRSKVELALKRGWIHTQTRKALERYLK